MSKVDAIRHATEQLSEAQKKLKEFDECVAKYHLQAIEKQAAKPERDVTESRRQDFVAVVDEWRSMLRYAEESWSA